MNIIHYLNRIGLGPTTSITKEYLYILHKHHLLNIPFENLDIHYGTPISLNLLDIYDKIVKNKRGGFCYELNGLFHSLLIKIGFNSKLISCRVHKEDDRYSPEFDHMAIIVELKDKSYLVDVGFGNFINYPLPISVNKEIKDKNGSFMFRKYTLENYFQLCRLKEGNLNPEYIFKNYVRNLNEFSEMCNFHQYSQKSQMAKKKMISMATKDGRITLTETDLVITKDGIKLKTIVSQKNFESLAKKFFKIEIG